MTAAEVSFGLCGHTLDNHTGGRVSDIGGPGWVGGGLDLPHLCWASVSPPVQWAGMG